MFEVPGSDLGSGDVREPGGSEGLSGAQVVVLPEVLIAGRAIEIRGAAAQLVQSILGEWLDAQNRRIEYLRRDPNPDTRAQIRKILARTAVVYRVLRAWEGVLAVPVSESDLQ